MYLETAIIIATNAHMDMVDKGGHPYILHPLRVMMRMTTADRKVLAVLHDVVEDSAWTLEELRAEGLSVDLALKLELLTRIPGVPYDRYIDGLANDPDTRAVKLADLWDNMNINRIPNLF